jgi:probable rRNA maturation factor
MTKATEPFAYDDAEPDSPGLTLDIDCRAKSWSAFEADLRAYADYVATALGLPPVELSLVLGDDALLSALNESYRGKTGPTNVLSFPALDLSAPIGLSADGTQAALLPGSILGDIVMSFDTLAREAEAGEKSLSAHAVHLLTHGLLHLLGHDHQEEAEAALMEGLETQLLVEAGFDDPYAASFKEELS